MSIPYVTAYSPKLRDRTHFKGITRTKGSFKDACDINVLMRKYQAANNSEFLRDSRGFCDGNFGDVSSVPQYQEARNRLIEAEEAFQRMPALVRERFKNNPEGLLSFLADSKNQDEAVKLGLISPPSPSSTLPPQPEPTK